MNEYDHYWEMAVKKGWLVPRTNNFDKRYWIKYWKELEKREKENESNLR